MEALRQIDRYRLLEEIGSGGMAVVYKGLDTALDREVAVKVMHPHLANKADSRRRFSREARAVARLRHPYILEIFDFSGDEAKESYIVTEYVRGCTLRAFGDEVGFGLPEIAALATEQLCEALQAAHEAGIVHRDLKPENVMVRDDGVLKLMDFGIARILEKDEKMTMTGALVGSPLHMAPEVIEGKDADVRADIFAMGTIFFWMVTGEMAFQGNSTHHTLRRILEGDYTDARMITPTCSDEIAEIIGRCLQREPADRYQTVGELRAALGPVLEQAGVESVEAELKAFFADPHGYRERMQQRLVARLLEAGETAMSHKRSARALSLFNRVLALDPENARVAEHLASMNRARVRARLLKRTAIGAAAAVGLVALAFAAKAGHDSWTEWQAQRERDVAEALAAAAPPPVVPVEAPAAAELTEKIEPAPAAPMPGPPPPERRDRPRAEPARGTARQVEPAPRVAMAEPPAPARKVDVTLRWFPAQAFIWIDNKRIDVNSPLWTGELEVGVRHELKFTGAECCDTWRGELRATADGVEVRGDNGEPAFRLPGYGARERLIRLTPRVARIRVDAQPDTAMVYRGDEVWLTVRETNRQGGYPVTFDASDPTMRGGYRKRVVLTIKPPPDQPGLFQDRHVAVEVRPGETRTATVGLLTELGP